MSLYAEPQGEGERGKEDISLQLKHVLCTDLCFLNSQNIGYTFQISVFLLHSLAQDKPINLKLHHTPYPSQMYVSQEKMAKQSLT